MSNEKTRVSRSVSAAALATVGLLGSLVLKWWINRWLPAPLIEDYPDARSGKWESP